MPGFDVVRLSRAAAVSPGRPAEIAALTRAAYRDSDPLPGLPIPDGAGETESSVRADLDRGAVMWVASGGVHAGAGDLAGALRVTAGSDGAWTVRRVSVSPAARGRGVARALMDAVDAAACSLGVPVIRLDAVVERCLPSLYARLGFFAVRHWPSGDKPLTEVTMERRPGTRVRPHARPWVRPPAEPGALLVIWLNTADALVAVVGDGHGRCPQAAAFPHARLAGADLWHGAGPREHAALMHRLGRHGRRAGDAVVRFPPDRGACHPHVMPRTVDPRLHAWCRFPPGAEPPLDGAGLPAAASPEALSSTVPSHAVRCT